MEFAKADGQPPVSTDVVHFTYIDSDGIVRGFGVIANFEGRFIFTGSGTVLEGIRETVTLLSWSPGYVFVGFSCYVPPGLEPTTTITSETTPLPTSTTAFEPQVLSAAGVAGQAPNCDQIGRHDIIVGDPDYRRDLDGDGNGVACESGNGNVPGGSLPYTGASTGLFLSVAGLVGGVGILVSLLVRRSPTYKAWKQERDQRLRDTLNMRAADKRSAHL